ncbi:MAG: membrane-bound lytic murein transglycosylase MltF [Xanthomonadales bacterium]|nr:membrane-bound lytic murein transglycosylase MltF [Xanthomonadales bacterium]
MSVTQRPVSRMPVAPRIARACALGLLLLVVAGLATCQRRPGALAQIRATGELRVATVNAVDTYYAGPERARGYEYDLVRGFADTLGARLKIITVADREAVLAAVASNRAQLGVGVAINKPRRRRVRFTPAYKTIPLAVVYKRYTPRPHDLADLSGRLTLTHDTAMADWLRRVQPNLAFKQAAGTDIEGVMAQIATGHVRTTVAPANLVALNQRYHPSLRVAFELEARERHLAWALSPADRAAGRDALYNKTIAYLHTARTSNLLTRLDERYYGHASRLGFIGGAEFARQVKARLARWRPYFKRAARDYGIDWRLLAAIAYQESRWDPSARSPTDVRGMMMLTESTAARMDIVDRRNPQQSIDGGTRYLLQLMERLPEAIERPDRVWYALAAYNLGLGHVLDARRLLSGAGRNPDIWFNMADALPDLDDARYARSLRYGLANGDIALAYVSNIRAYYDILRWMSDRREVADDDKLAVAPARGLYDTARPDLAAAAPVF